MRHAICTCAATLALLITPTSPSRADDPPLKIAPPDLSETVRPLLRAVFLIGHPGEPAGTGFAIAKRPRLLVTAAHVADLRERTTDLYAAMNETGWTYKVTRVWYHPGIIRRDRDGQRFRGDPSIGPIRGPGPDVAILELENEGEDLPVIFPLASPREAAEMVARPVATLGFPSRDAHRWPEEGEVPSATYDQGVVSRLTDYGGNAGISPVERRLVQYTIPTWSGASGSPLFLPNGRVVAVVTHLRATATPAAGGSTLVGTVSQAVRCDVIWEALRAAHLAQHVAGSRAGLEVLTYPQGKIPDARLDQAIAVTKTGWKLLGSKEITRFRDAGEKAAEVIELAPEYWGGYDLRAQTYLAYARYLSEQGVTGEKVVYYLNLALINAARLTELDPSSVANYRNFAYVACGYSAIHRNEAILKGVVHDTAQKLKLRLTKWEQHALWEVRG